MARPQQFDSEALLESMRETFLELGPGASTQELARRAGVSEGTLYKRFVSKRRMFTESLRLPELEDFEWFRAIDERAGVMPIEEHLVELAGGMHRYASELIPCTQMIGANGKLRPQDFAQLLGADEEAPPLVNIRKISGLFEREMTLGRMRRGDALGLARLFIGAVIHDVHLRMYFPHSLPESAEAVVRRIARTVAELAAMGAEAAEPVRPGRSGRRPSGSR